MEPSRRYGEAGETRCEGRGERKTNPTFFTTPRVSTATRECSGEANVRYAGDVVPNEGHAESGLQ